MNPNIDQFPMANTGPTGANVQGAEFVASNHVAEQLPSREATSFAPAQPAVPPAPVATNSVQALVPNPVPPTPAQNVATANVPQVMGSEEDLEKKWVAVAKTIVERTKGDPYLQSQQISKAGKEFRAQTGRGVNPSEE